MSSALGRHWPEYLMEAAELGLFMVSACFCGVLLEHPTSPIRQALGDALARRALMGAAMGATAVAIIYSPWGKQSGAHFNPAVTLTFWRLGKVNGPDAGFYVAAQFAGGLAGVVAAHAFLGGLLAHPTVGYVATVPGPSVALAFAAEVAMTFVIMSVVLGAANKKRLAPLTGVFTGCLVAIYITFEAPISGMSLNPARTFASALPSGMWTAFWLYLAAPTLGMLAAAEVRRRMTGAAPPHCAKLHHQNRYRCIFCGEAGLSERLAAPDSRRDVKPRTPRFRETAHGGGHVGRWE